MHNDYSVILRRASARRIPEASWNGVIHVAGAAEGASGRSPDRCDSDSVWTADGKQFIEVVASLTRSLKLIPSRRHNVVSFCYNVVIMGERRVGIRELKAKLSGYIHEMKKGNTIVITERGTEVGRIIPAAGSAEDRMQSLVRSGFADWNGRKLKPGRAVARLKRGAKTLAEMVSEDRD